MLKWGIEMPYKNKEKRRATQKENYRNNLKCREKTYERTRKRKQRIATYILQIKNQAICKCGENHPACLVFHHRNPEEKEFDIATAVRNGYGEVRLAKEIKKCDLMCSNCHLKLHWEENSKLYPNGYYRPQYINP